MIIFVLDNFHKKVLLLVLSFVFISVSEDLYNKLYRIYIFCSPSVADYIYKENP